MVEEEKGVKYNIIRIFGKNAVCEIVSNENEIDKKIIKTTLVYKELEKSNIKFYYERGSKLYARNSTSSSFDGNILIFYVKKHKENITPYSSRHRTTTVSTKAEMKFGGSIAIEELVYGHLKEYAFVKKYK